jgi:hypothetical protein
MYRAASSRSKPRGAYAIGSGFGSARIDAPSNASTRLAFTTHQIDCRVAIAPISSDVGPIWGQRLISLLCTTELVVVSNRRVKEIAVPQALPRCLNALRNEKAPTKSRGCSILLGSVCATHVRNGRVCFYRKSAGKSVIWITDPQKASGPAKRPVRGATACYGVTPSVNVRRAHSARCRSAEQSGSDDFVEVWPRRIRVVPQRRCLSAGAMFSPIATARRAAKCGPERRVKAKGIVLVSARWPGAALYRRPDTGASQRR